MSEASKGVWAMIAACTIWGLSPLYYRMIAYVPPLEVLSHRTFWSVVIFGLVLAVQGRLGEVSQAFRARKNVAVLAVSGLLISSNWFFFIYSVQIDHVTEASLGYYLFPLLTVLLGVVFLGERLSRLQFLSVGLAALAVMVLTIGLGVAPWISLFLAATFALYGLAKKSLGLGPVVSVTCEVLILLPLALIWLYGASFLGWTGVTGRTGGYFGANFHDTGLLIFSGVMTASPLILFSYATKRLTMASLGLTQYVNPSLQFLLAVLVLGEAFTRWHAIAFGLIWAALALYSAESLRLERSSRRRKTNLSRSGSTRM